MPIWLELKIILHIEIWADEILKIITWVLIRNSFEIHNAISK